MELEIGQMWHFNAYVKGVWDLSEIGDEFFSDVTTIPTSLGRELKFIKLKSDGNVDTFNFFESALAEHAKCVGMHYPSVLVEEYPNRLARVD